MAKSLDIIDPKRDMDMGDDSPRQDREDREERQGEEEKVVQATGSEEHSGGLFYLIIGIIAVIVSASLALYILFKDNKTSGTPAKTASATSTASTVASNTATASATESAAATGTTTATSAFKYTNEQIRIANGNSKAGEAARIKTALEAKGYKIATVGNATKQYDESIIYYKTGQEKLANALKTDLAGEYSATVELSDTTVGTYDAVVVLGAK